MRNFIPNFKSIHGKITLLILLLVLNFVFFSAYIVFENFKLKSNYKTLSTQAEPLVTLRFIAMFQHLCGQYSISEAIINKDTTGQASGFAFSSNSFSDVINIMQLHADSLHIGTEFKVFKDSIDYYNALKISQGKNLFDVITLRNKLHNNKKYAEAAQADSILKVTFNTNFKKSYDKVLEKLNDGVSNHIKIKENLVKLLSDQIARIAAVCLVVTILILIFSVFIWLNSIAYIKKSIKQIMNKFTDISQGILQKEVIKDKNETGDIFQSANDLIDNMQKAGDFASHIGKGDFDFEFQPISANDALGHALLTMRNELQKFKIEDQKRLWTNIGFSKFGELLRTHNTNLQLLSDNLLSALIKYIDANQGAVFIANSENNDAHLHMIACYAYSKKKFIDTKILIGEGLVGQVFLEKEHLYYNEIPQNYIKITSGLGESLPNSLLIMPIKLDNDVLGVLEIASFKPMQEHQIAFVNKVCDDFASVIKSVVSNQKTQQLLEELQLKTEQMKAQEEELLQNMEELMATQEQMVRKESVLVQ